MRVVSRFVLLSLIVLLLPLRGLAAVGVMPCHALGAATKGAATSAHAVHGATHVADASEHESGHTGHPGHGGYDGHDGHDVHDGPGKGVPAEGAAADEGGCQHCAPCCAPVAPSAAQGPHGLPASPSVHTAWHAPHELALSVAIPERPPRNTSA